MRIIFAVVIEVNIENDFKYAGQANRQSCKKIVEEKYKNFESEILSTSKFCK